MTDESESSLVASISLIEDLSTVLELSRINWSEFGVRMIRYDAWFALENWQASCPFNLAHKLKRTEDVFNRNEMGETEMELLLCKT